MSLAIPTNSPGRFNFNIFGDTKKTLSNFSDRQIKRTQLASEDARIANKIEADKQAAAATAAHRASILANSTASLNSTLAINKAKEGRLADTFKREEIDRNAAEKAAVMQARGDLTVDDQTAGLDLPDDPEARLLHANAINDAKTVAGEAINISDANALEINTLSDAATAARLNAEKLKPLNKRDINKTYKDRMKEIDNLLATDISFTNKDHWAARQAAHKTKWKALESLEYQNPNFFPSRAHEVAFNNKKIAENEAYAEAKKSYKDIKKEFDERASVGTKMVNARQSTAEKKAVEKIRDTYKKDRTKDEMIAEADRIVKDISTKEKLTGPEIIALKKEVTKELALSLTPITEKDKELKDRASKFWEARMESNEKIRVNKSDPTKTKATSSDKAARRVHEENKLELAALQGEWFMTDEKEALQRKINAYNSSEGL